MNFAVWLGPRHDGPGFPGPPSAPLVHRLKTDRLPYMITVIAVPSGPLRAKETFFAAPEDLAGMREGVEPGSSQLRAIAWGFIDGFPDVPFIREGPVTLTVNN